LFLAIGVSGTFFSSKVFRNKSNVLRFKKPNLKKQVNDDGFKTQYFTQKLDHFNFQSNGENTYEQRYLINTDYWDKSPSPIFFYTGNEGDIESFKQASGFVTWFGKDSKAMIVFAEHRYYGKSLPFGDKSFDEGNIGLLTMEQAMADFATLIQHLKKEYDCEKSPVITFGGSYGGQLAAYMRIRYPNLVEGALSASAPLYWITGEGDSHGFWKSVTDTFSASAEGCKQTVIDGFQQLQSKADSGNYDEISNIFNTCQQITKENYTHLLEWIRNAFTILAMMNYPYPTNFLAPLPGHPVKEACYNAVGASTSLEGLAQITGLNYGNTTQCHDIMQEYVHCSDPTGCGLGNDAVAWDYQACTEIILPGGTTGVDDMFPVIKFDDQDRVDYCQEKYKVQPRKNWIHMDFWTDKLVLASNIIFSNGDLDPWGPGGVNKDLSKNLPYVFVKGGAHHFDLRGPHANDPQTVIDAREEEKKIISQWINDAQNK